MKNIITAVFCSLLLAGACSNTNDVEYGGKKPGIYTQDLAEQNLLRAMEIVDNAVANYFSGDEMILADKYNPYTGNRSADKGSIWKYTSSIEAVNAVMEGLELRKKNGSPELYDRHFDRYAGVLAKLYDNADYYLGTYTLVSYTQTREWTVYGVDRSQKGKGMAEVQGIKNVYDDQQWLIRELIGAYRLTGEAEYLKQAEYLTEYVLDGWDCTLDADGREHGGITWGPGYSTKHSCSNGPLVSPLVWLHELYKGKSDQITYGYIKPDRSRSAKTVKKSDYYLDFAKKVYDWQKTHLMRGDGVYADMMHNPGTNLNPGDIDLGEGVQLELIDGVYYRKHASMAGSTGDAISYNSGTMLSGAADLYRVTGDDAYMQDLAKLTADTFRYFAKLGATLPGYYTYEISGFNDWFNNVLMRGYVDAEGVGADAAACIDSFQKNLDYAYENHVYGGMLPTNLLVGWNRDRGKNDTEALFTFAFAAEYAVLAKYEMEKN